MNAFVGDEYPVKVGLFFAKIDYITINKDIQKQTMSSIINSITTLSILYLNPDEKRPDKSSCSWPYKCGAALSC